MLPSLESLQLSAYIGISRLAVLAGRLKADLSGEMVPKEVELTQVINIFVALFDSIIIQSLLIQTTDLRSLFPLAMYK